MPLTLSFHENDAFYVGDAEFTVEQVGLARGCTVRNSETGEEFAVEPEKATPVTPECKLSEGHRVIAGKTRIVFMAPKSVRILRGDNIDREEHASVHPS